MNFPNVTQSSESLRVLGQTLVPAQYPQGGYWSPRVNPTGSRAAMYRNESFHHCGYHADSAGTRTEIHISSTRILDLSFSLVKAILRVLAGTCGYYTEPPRIEKGVTGQYNTLTYIGLGTQSPVPASTRNTDFATHSSRGPAPGGAP